jgi:transposase
MLTMAAPRLELTDDEREALEVVARSSSLPHRAVLQAKGLLLAAEGVANNEIARRCAVTPNAVRRWRSKFADEGVEGVGRIRPGRGRPPELSAGLIEAIVHDTLRTTPEGATHWATRSMAEHAGVGKDTVARIWRARKLRPWRVETYLTERALAAEVPDQRLFLGETALQDTRRHLAEGQSARVKGLASVHIGRAARRRTRKPVHHGREKLRAPRWRNRLASSTSPPSGSRQYPFRFGPPPSHESLPGAPHAECALVPDHRGALSR